MLPSTNIDTDQIIPARFLHDHDARKAWASRLFADWRYDASGAPKPDFVLNQPEAAGCAILVAGRNFGCGSSREHAPWALLDFGFRAVVSTEIADIFRSNSLKNGLLPIVVDEQTHALAAGASRRRRADRPARRARCTLPDGTAVEFPLEAFARYCLLNGVDELGFLLQQADAIARYEQTRASGFRTHEHQSNDRRPRRRRHRPRSHARRRARAARRSPARYGHDFTFEEHLIGGAAIDATQTALPAQTLSACGTADAVLLGAVGGPKWSDPNAKVRPEQGLLGAAQGAGPVREPAPGHAASGAARRLAAQARGAAAAPTSWSCASSPAASTSARSTAPSDFASDLCTYSVEEIERVTRVAGTSRARTPQVASCRSTRPTCWRPRACGAATVEAVLRDEFPDVKLEHMLVDSAAMHLIRKPASFDVILTENMFGDILTDEASMLAGSLGLLPSASLGAGKLGLYEPIHGSAPDIAGKGIANPYGTILSVGDAAAAFARSARGGRGGRKSGRGEPSRRASGRPILPPAARPPRPPRRATPCKTRCSR